MNATGHYADSNAEPHQSLRLPPGVRLPSPFEVQKPLQRSRKLTRAEYKALTWKVDHMTRPANSTFGALPPEGPSLRRARAAHAAAVDAMHAARPLTPPPMPRAAYAPRSGELALLADVRSGAYTP